MKNLKKILSLFIASCIVCSFFGCGKEDGKGKKEEAPLEQQTQENPYEIQSPTVYGEVNEPKIDLEPIDININPITPVEVSDARIEFDIEDIEHNLSDNLTDAELAKIGNLSDNEKKEILEKKSSMMEKLILEFKAHNVNISINEISGEIVMDSSILFANDKADVSKSGKDFLKTFITAYASVLCDEEYVDFIDKIIVEGHTDTNGAYDYNKKLSENRAKNVETFCLSDEVNLNSSQKSVLKNKIESVGCSYDRPVSDSNGNVDMAASRRVTFRFMIHIG